MNAPPDIDEQGDEGEAKPNRGRLKVFLGAAPGVGKTWEMLLDGAARRAAGVDVVIGIAEIHGRPEAQALIGDIEVVPRREASGHPREMDLDAVLARRPALVLVDDLAHVNAPGGRHTRRWQDVEELLAAGLDVFATLNIQHLESLNDLVAAVTKLRIEATVPDRILEHAEIEMVDIPPDELIERLKEGKVHVPPEATRAMAQYFSKPTLSALREMALRRAAQTVDEQMLDELKAEALAGSWAAGERIIVAVSELPGADGLVRATKRLADAQRAPWIAVYIETPRARTFGEEERQRIAAVLQLAGQLGARVASIPAQSVLDGIKRFAEERRATQIVVGKSARSRLFELRHGSVVDHLVRETPGIAVHVLPMEPGTPDEGARGRARAAAPARRSGWGRPTDYLWSALAVAGITLLGTSIYTLGHITNIGLLYLIPVMFAATRYGLRAGIVTGLLSSLCYNFFFLHPAYSLTIHAQNLITLLVLIGVAVVASQLAERVRTQAELARSSASQNSALAGFARSLTGATTGVALGQTLCGEAARLFGVDAVLLLPDNGELKVAAAVPPEDRLGAIEQAAVAWAFEHGQPAGLGSDTLTASDWLFQPLRAGGKTLGVLGLARPEGGNAVRSDELPLLLSLIDQAALALERILLEDEMATVAQLKERDRVRAALLSSVSRDVKAPLATMLSAIAELRREGVDAARLDPLQAMAERLNRFAANLVDLSRIEAGSLALAPEPVDLAEAAAEAAHELRHALKGHAIQLDVSPELPPVRVDPELLRRCLVNLLELAGKYAEAETPIAIAAVRKADGLKLSIMDEGPGLPAYGEGRSLEADGKSGAGLGLAITRSLARALGLSVSVGPRAEPAGAVFTLRFPDSVLVKKGAEPA